MAGLHPAIGRCVEGRVELVITLDAPGVQAGMVTVFELVRGRPVRAVRILPTVDFDELVDPGGSGL